MPAAPDGQGAAGGSRTFRFPLGAVECRPGDYVICRSESGWRVSRVDDVVAIERLMVRATSPISLVVEGDLLDSMRPAYFGEVHLLLTVFDEHFLDESAATHAIRQQALTERDRGLLRAAREFSAASCRVVRPG